MDIQMAEMVKIILSSLRLLLLRNYFQQIHFNSIRALEIRSLGGRSISPGTFLYT